MSSPVSSPLHTVWKSMSCHPHRTQHAYMACCDFLSLYRMLQHSARKVAGSLVLCNVCT